MFGQTVTRLRATPKSSPYAHGANVATTEDWSNPDRLTMENVGVAPTASLIRYEDIGAPVESGISLLFIGKVGVDVKARDRFEIDGDVWLVAGDPEEYVSPFTGYIGGTVVHLKREQNA